MEGTAAAAAKTEEKTPGKIVSAGVPVRADMSVQSFTGAEQNGDAGATGAAPGDEKEKKAGEAGDGKEKVDAKEKTDDGKTNPPKMTEADFLAFAKEQGIEVPDFKTLKEKVAGPAPTKTPEQIKAEETDLEKKMIAAHLKRGGTVEQYAEFKNIVAADPKILGLSKLQAELVQDGFSKEDSELIIKNMHLQYTEEEIADFTPEQQEKVKKQAAFGLKKQENRGKYLQNTAKSYLEILKSEVQDQDAEVRESAKHSSKVEDAIKNFQRKQILELGEYDGQKLDPVEVELSDDVLNSVKDILLDPAKLKKTLYTADGELNLDFLVPHLVASVSRETSVKHAYLSGQSKQVDIFKSKFGEKVPELGGPKKADGVKGKIVSAGKPEYMRPTT